jgi:hypothetical protein
MCQFNLSFSGPAESLMSRAKQEIERAGGSLNGDSWQGSFRAKTPIGSIQGNYQVTGQEISLTIVKKPLLLSCKRIQKELGEVMV